ncbi:hypothetical protein BT96DRAFT_949847 [Gymnopus androsaceus JB14]|uniref:Uncharacterized protein n=1 Tax=Gymnopus androsaceus JB14 TaxID=1447944 RepID=A0A6A4GIL8_9AGAR|nr:hypothetical protein BT96DRAFT_949847 [Gymnopus androsaceus JB14]
MNNIPSTRGTSQTLRTVPAQQRVLAPIRELSPTSDENEPEFPQPNDAQVSRKRKYDVFASKAVHEWDSKSKSCNSQENQERRLAEREAEAAELGISIDDLPEDPQEPEDVDSDNVDDLDDDIDEEAEQSAQTQIMRKLGDYSKFTTRCPKLHSRLLETLEFDESDTLNACLSLMSKEKDAKRRTDSNTIKGAVVAWLPHVWPGSVKVKTVEGSYPLPTATIDKSNERGFSGSSTACIQLLSELKNHQIQLLADDWPALLHDLDAFRASNKWKGYLRGKLLLYTLRTIFTLPTSALGQQNIKTKGGNTKDPWPYKGMYLFMSRYVFPTESTAHSSGSLFQIFSSTRNLMVSSTSNSSTTSFSNPSRKERKSPRSGADELFQWWDVQVFGDKLPQVTTTTSDPFQDDPDAASDNEIDADVGTDTEM